MTASGVDDDLRHHIDCYLATVFSVSLTGALSVLLIYWLTLRLKGTKSDAAIIALTIGFGTIFFPFSTLFFSHVSAAFFLLLAFYQILAHKQIVLTRLATLEESEQSVQDQRWRLMLAGFGLGFSITLEYPSAIAVALIGLYALPLFIQKRELRNDFPALIIGGLAGLLPLVVYNFYAFHKPFYITYEAYAQSANTAYQAHKQGVLGIRFPLLDPSAWPQFWSNLCEITYKPLRGIFFANPVLLLIFPGFVMLLREKRWKTWAVRDEALLSIMMFLAFVSFNASFGDSITYWGGGASFGPRYLIVMLPFLTLPLLMALQNRWLRAAFIPLALISAFFCLMATAVEPRTPYSPANPIFFFYFPRYLTGALAINDIGIFSNLKMTATSVSFNWGRLLNLSIQFQLLPLFLIWLIAMWHLDRELMIQQRGYLFAIGLFVLIAAGLPAAALF